jgi:iron complex transport system ATP-binding protein
MRVRLPRSLFFLMPSSPRPPTLQVRDLTYRRGREILRGISWTVDHGQHWCVLGPNGCGKSTLINVITGYDSATSGDISIDGAHYGDDDWREVRKRVGLVASTLSVMLESGEPVIDVVASGRDAKLNLWEPPSAALKKEAAALLKRMGCSYLLNALWGPLSQGEKQKVLICRAMMAQFRVLILDEPCAGLDPVAREHFLTWLQKLGAKRGAPSLIMVTHHVEEILPCMKHVLLLREGQAQAAGPLEKVLTSKGLTKAYGSPVKVWQDQEGRHRLSVG